MKKSAISSNGAPLVTLEEYQQRADEANQFKG